MCISMHTSQYMYTVYDFRPEEIELFLKQIIFCVQDFLQVHLVT